MLRMLCMVLVLQLAVGGVLAQEGETASATADDDAEAWRKPRVKLETTLGDIVLELYTEKAPITVDNFVLYCGAKFYEGTVFHRVIPNFMIQGGGYDENMEQKRSGLRPPIRNEWRNGLKNERGTIAMARTGDPDSATAQFFINVVDNSQLDNPRDGAAYCVFGRVVEGMDVVDKIKDTKLIRHPKLPFPQPVTPETPVVIRSAQVLTTYDRAYVEPLIRESHARLDRYAADPLLYQEEQLKDWISKAEAESGNKLQKSETGLRWVVLKEGDGPKPQPTDTVDAHYTGWLVSGDKFDSSVDRGQPLPVRLSGGVIQGWLEALGTMRVGDKRRLFIPPDLGYGQRGSPPVIPPNAILIFDVEMVGIK